MRRPVRRPLRLLVVCGIVVACGVAHAQAPSQISTQTRPPEFSKGTLGIILDGALNLHRANFQALPGVPNCCPLFEGGAGLGGEFAFFYDYDAFGDGHIGLRAGVISLAGTLTADESVTLAING